MASPGCRKECNDAAVLRRPAGRNIHSSSSSQEADIWRLMCRFICHRLTASALKRSPLGFKPGTRRLGMQQLGDFNLYVGPSRSMQGEK